MLIEFKTRKVRGRDLSVHLKSHVGFGLQLMDLQPGRHNRGAGGMGGFQAAV